jgi:hypothetical protein
VGDVDVSAGEFEFKFGESASASASACTGAVVAAGMGGSRSCEVLTCSSSEYSEVKLERAESVGVGGIGARALGNCSRVGREEVYGGGRESSYWYWSWRGDSNTWGGEWYIVVVVVLWCVFVLW